MALNTSKEKALLSLMEQTGYEIVQENGQRKFGPPPDWVGPPPKKGSEVFVGKIPRDCYEDELVPLFQQIGRIYELRLMMDFSGCNRGYAFLMYTNPHDAKKAVQKLNNFEIRPGKSIGVVKSLDNCRLFVGKLPRDRSREEIIEEMKNVTDGVVNAIVHCYSQSRAKNRGYAFVEYENHRAAAMARRKLLPGKIKLWGTCDIQVDWAEPEPEVDEEIMSKVRILYVRNLMPDIGEDDIRSFFSLNGKLMVEHVKKIKDYAFVHYKSRQEAEEALTTLHNRDCSMLSCENGNLEITWAKPSDQKKARKRNNIRNRNNVINNNPLDAFVNQSFPQYYGGFGDGPVYDYGNHLTAAPPQYAASVLGPSTVAGMDMSQLRLDGTKLPVPWPRQPDLMKSRDRTNNKPRIMTPPHFISQAPFPQYPSYAGHPFGDGSMFGLPAASQYPILFPK